jgi:hypothetical protein
MFYPSIFVRDLSGGLVLELIIIVLGVYSAEAWDRRV